MASESGSNFGMGMMIALLLVIVIAALFFMFGSNMMGGGTSAPAAPEGGDATIQVPDEVDVNVGEGGQ